MLIVGESLAPFYEPMFCGFYAVLGLGLVSFIPSALGHWSGLLMAAPSAILGLMMMFIVAVSGGLGIFIVMSAMLIVIGAASIGLWTLNLRRFDIKIQGFCWNCGHDLRGRSGACPECGAERKPLEISPESRPSPSSEASKELSKRDQT